MQNAPSIHRSISFQHNGRLFRANVQNTQLSGAAGPYVSAVSGLESHQVRPLISRAVNLKTKQPFPSVTLSKVQTSGGLSSIITNQAGKILGKSPISDKTAAIFVRDHAH